MVLCAVHKVYYKKAGQPNLCVLIEKPFAPNGLLSGRTGKPNSILIAGMSLLGLICSQ